MSDDQELASHYLAETRAGFRALKTQADGAIEQMADDELFAALDPEANSVAVIMRHLAGNLRSRWSDFLTTDGEKPDRDRDAEFEPPPSRSRAALLAEWEAGWRVLHASLEALAPGDLLRTVTIRGEPHSVVRAIERGMRHVASHVGQIVLLAKHARGSQWRTLSIPRGQSRTWRPPLPPPAPPRS